MPKQKLFSRLNRRSLIILLIFIIGLYVILPQISSFHSSIKYLSKPHIIYLLIALVFSFLTYLEAATSYFLLAFKKLNIKEMYFIQLAIMFVNNLLPAGIGGIGANYAYLKHKKNTSTQSASMVTVNNILGLIGHFILIIIVLSISPSHQFTPNISSNLLKEFLPVLLLVIVIILVVGLIYGRQKLIKFTHDLIKQLKTYKDRLINILLTLLVQMSLTLSNVLCLYFATKSVHLNLAFSSVLIIFTLGSSIKNATPTPGGLGGYEAGLLVGFAAYKIDIAQSIAAILFFRLVNFWIPLLCGFISFIYNERKGRFSIATSESY